jgi:DNA-binding transcriptional regulator/RsmH inhibitor MraZ
MHLEKYCSSHIKPVREQSARDVPFIFNNRILLTQRYKQRSQISCSIMVVGNCTSLYTKRQKYTYILATQKKEETSSDAGHCRSIKGLWKVS